MQGTTHNLGTESSPEDEPLQVESRLAWMVLGLVCVPVFLGSIDLTVVSAFLPRLLSDLGLVLDAQGLGNASWILTSYLLAYSISLFTMGRVSDLIGRRAALAICLTLYIIGSILVVGYTIPAAALTVIYDIIGVGVDESIINLHAIVLARIIAAFGAGAITSIAIALVGDLFKAEARAVPLGIVVATDTVGWLIGAAWGGFIIQFLPWQAIFLINIPLVLIALGLMLWVLRKVPQWRESGRLDVLGFGLLTAVLTLLNIGLVNIQTSAEGLNLSTTLPAFGAAGIFFAFFIWSQLRSPQPLINMNLFRDRGVTTATILNTLVGYAMFIPLVSVPLLINIQNIEEIGFATVVEPIRENAFKNASLQTGLLMGAFTIPLALASVVSGWMIDRIGAAWTALIGLVMAFVGFGLNWQLLSLDTPNIQTAALMALTGAGIGLTFTPVITTTLNAVKEGERGMASALILGMRMVGMTLSTSTMSSFAAQRINDLVIAVESGRLIFDLVPPAEYANVYPTTFINSATQMLGEMALIGLATILVALVPALLLPRRAVTQA